MNRISIRIDDARAREAFDRAPEVMRRYVSEAAEQGAMTIANAARRSTVFLDAFGTLRQSIHVAPVEGLPPEQVGFEARTGVAYARYVEEGSGPAAGRPRYYPNPDSLRQYLTHSPRMRRFKWKGRAGSDRRSEQEYDIWWRARAMAWSIYMRGTRAKPYMRPAAEQSEARVRQILKGAVARGVAEVFGNG